MKIRNELLSQVRSYAGHTPHAAEDTLDCSLGVNPYGFPPVVKEAFAAFDPERFYHYPHSYAPQKAIVDDWADYAFIEPENIVLTDGSVSALYLLCNILAKKGAEVVGFILNDATPDRKKYYSYYSKYGRKYKYGYDYGYSYNYK